MNSIFRSFHRYIGLVIAIPFMLCCASGTLLLFKQNWLEWQYPQLASANTDEVLVVQQAQQLKSISRQISSAELSYARVADERQAYALAVDVLGRHWLFDRDGQLVVRFETSHPWVWLPKLHANWMLGKPGKQINGILSILVLLLLLSALLLCWQKFEWRHLRRWLSKEERPLHRSYFRHIGPGWWAFPGLLLLCITAVLLIYRSPILDALESPSVAQAIVSDAPAQTGTGWQQRWPQVAKLMEQDQPTLIRSVDAAQGIWAIRGRAPNSWHPHGRQMYQFQWNNHGELIAASKRQATIGDRLIGAGFALHAGQVARPWMLYALLFSGLAVLASLAYSLQLAWRRRTIDA
ncbi:PepSY-associated TM helix domain-containing protein [Paraferrimonas sedimenticola]|uniref:PepSY domain-containing protein n=1 Tax=Paraferrimonas sedimenticola TaxID=375674 RepID=A0AA37RZA9_9GAMM|nr:PepSY-associated TM helix domain-containing protein [Paraferrimonas sedimenticola]GLP97652.1 hypothetical protein GCM10007895_29590 [Paraferrimonas sedimenticola]